MSEFLIDANVFFKVFKSDEAVRNYLENLDFVVDITVYIECLQGSKSNLEKRKIGNYLDNFPLLLLSEDAAKLALNLIRQYSNTNGLLLPDALIAANAIENGLKLITYNINDFKFIAGLNVIKPNV